jgi:hypothetical protein
MDFLNHREGVRFAIRFSSFSFTVYSNCSRNCRGASLKKYKFQGKAVEVTGNSKEENS